MTHDPIARGLLLLALVSLTTQCATAQAPGPAQEDTPEGVRADSKASWSTVATYEAKALAEISGLAPSGLRQGVLWAHNDSGGGAELHAIDLSGSALGSVRLRNTKNQDWEALSPFTYQGKSYLLIADTGDNKRKRATVRLHAVAEPAPNPDGTYTDIEVDPAWSLTLRYEDGPQDCEAVAVVPGQERVLLLNKDAKTSVIYAAPLRPNQKARGAEKVVTAKRFAVLPAVSNATGNVIAFLKAGVLGTRATGMDIAPDGSEAVVLTYTDIRRFRRAPNQSWREAFQQTPAVVALPSVYQPEALCYSRDSRMIYVSSEESPTPLLRYRLTP